jgi:hypothetical protein
MEVSQKAPQKKTRKKVLIFTASVLVAAILLYYFFNRASLPPPPPPLDGFLPISVPTNDSACIGKLYDNGVLKGNGITKYNTNTSYDSIRKYSGINDIAKLKLSIQKALNASVEIRNKNITVTAIDSLIVLSVDDYSTLPLPQEGALVVSAAIGVKKIRISSNRSTGGDLQLDSAKKIFKGASVSIDNSDSSVKFGTGLISYVRVIKVKKDTTLSYKVNWEGESSQVLDTYLNDKDFLSFSNITLLERGKYHTEYNVPSACLKIVLMVHALDSHKDSIVFSPRNDQIIIQGISKTFYDHAPSDYYIPIGELSGSLPRGILNKMEDKKIYKYSVLIDSAKVLLGNIRSTVAGAIRAVTLYPVSKSTGKLTLFFVVWSYTKFIQSN